MRVAVWGREGARCLAGVVLLLQPAWAASPHQPPSEEFDLQTVAVVSRGELDGAPLPADLRSSKPKLKQHQLRAWGKVHLLRPPDAWQAIVDPARGILTLEHPVQKGTRIDVWRHAAETNAEGEQPVDAWCNRVLARHPTLVLDSPTNGLTVGTPWGKGLLFELSEPTTKASRRAAQCVVVRAPFGTLEFELRSVYYWVNRLSPEFLQFINSFRLIQPEPSEPADAKGAVPTPTP